MPNFTTEKVGDEAGIKKVRLTFKNPSNNDSQYRSMKLCATTVNSSTNNLITSEMMNFNDTVPE